MSLLVPENVTKKTWRCQETSPKKHQSYKKHHKTKHQGTKKHHEKKHQCIKTTFRFSNVLDVGKMKCKNTTKSLENEGRNKNEKTG